jgi:hypothetical protein
MLRTKLAAAAAHWNRRNQWDGDGAYGITNKKDSARSTNVQFAEAAAVLE